VARPASHPPPPPGLLALRAALSKGLGGHGSSAGAYVYDLTGGRALYGLGATTRRPPASVEKLYTTVAALRLLGPAARLPTEVLGTGHLAGGTWHGSLYLRGGGDPTFGDGTFNRNFEQGYGPTAAELATQLRARGIRRVTGRLYGDGSLFGPERAGPATAFAPDLPDYGGELGGLTFDHGATSGSLSPEAFAARQLARTLRSQHVEVLAAPAGARTPRLAQRLAGVSSPPLSVLLRLMDVPSDDLFAEMLTEQLGARYGAGGTIAAGAAVIAQQIAAYGLHPRIVDGSGLSRTDASSPLEVVTLLQRVWHTPIGQGLESSLPVVGQSGTVAALAQRTPAAGHCVAKTGTLNRVTNLAGVCMAAHHHVVAFALFLDGPENWLALPRLGRLVAAIARY
jgi:D-alanyl-D-alanine carboxypeptidase/D-alanyl-D-alanine-endopeptidase (penicillin-binding protein 4)